MPRLQVSVALIGLHRFAVGQLNQYEDVNAVNEVGTTAHPTSTPSKYPTLSLDSEEASSSWTDTIHMDHITIIVIVLIVAIVFASVACCFFAFGCSDRRSKSNNYCCASYTEVDSDNDHNICCGCKTVIRNTEKAVRRISNASQSSRYDTRNTSTLTEITVHTPVEPEIDPGTQIRISAMGFENYKPTRGREFTPKAENRARASTSAAVGETPSDEDDAKRVRDDSGTEPIRGAACADSSGTRVDNLQSEMPEMKCMPIRDHGRSNARLEPVPQNSDSDDDDELDTSAASSRTKTYHNMHGDEDYAAVASESSSAKRPTYQRSDLALRNALKDEVKTQKQLMALVKDTGTMVARLREISNRTANPHERSQKVQQRKEARLKRKMEFWTQKFWVHIEAHGIFDEQRRAEDVTLRKIEAKLEKLGVDADELFRSRKPNPLEDRDEDYAPVASESSSAKRPTVVFRENDDRVIEDEKTPPSCASSKQTYNAVVYNLLIRSAAIAKFDVRGPRIDSIKHNTKHNVKILQEYNVEIGDNEGNAKIFVCEGSVVSFSGEAIVNAANESMLGGSGVDGAISVAGGDVLRRLREAEPILPRPKGGERKRCETGDAKITLSGYPHNKLQCDFVIHAVGPDYRAPRYKGRSQTDIDTLLSSAYANSMKLCETYGLKSVGFCLISAGVFRGTRSLKGVIAEGLQAINLHIFADAEVFVIGYSKEEVKCLRSVAQTVLTRNRRVTRIRHSCT